MRTLPILVAALVLAGGAARAEEPIVGKYRIPNGETASVKPCGGAFCITAETGKFAGKRVGRVSGTGNSYAGEITDPNNDKTYEGTAKLSGAKLTLRGCALKVFCRSQVWTKL